MPFERYEWADMISIDRTGSFTLVDAYELPFKYFGVLVFESLLKTAFYCDFSIVHI